MMRFLAWGSVAVAYVSGDMLWPPSMSGAPDTWGDFGQGWHILSGAFAAHSAQGGRTVATRAGEASKGKLLIFLPGTFTIPAQFSTFLKYSASLGFDTIGLDYAWGPAPDSKRSQQCAESANCESCQTNFHEVVMSGDGDDLISGPLPVFGHNQTSTLKFTHFFAYGVQFLPATELPVVDLASPLSLTSREYILSMQDFSVEVLLAKVLQELAWSDYFSSEDGVIWSKVVVAGHSQGASHAGHVAFSRRVLGALMLSGPQDMCGDSGAAVPSGQFPHIFGCYAVDEPGAAAIRSNSHAFWEVLTFNSTGSPRNHGEGLWCPPKPHCSSAVDDQLVDAAIETCFPLLQRILDDTNSSPTSNTAPSSPEISLGAFCTSRMALLVGLFSWVFPRH